MVSALQKSRLGTFLPTPFDSMHREMNELFHQFFGDGAGEKTPLGRTWCAPASLWEGDNEFHVEVDLPGVKSDDVDVTVEKGTLRISAERKAPEDERTYWHQERGFGHLERLVKLPEAVDSETIEAELTDGVLHVKLAKKPEDQPKKIPVKVG